ncbi:Rieske 2Fe-2S domain-containing protein [Pseudonocardia sp. TRM90224]|uniref:Rieske 2Fe-2S domain-containing protein n=1 Tax=Pseudonocardia sp. TRM90224 TaxID=2812678 RepID=UPI001E5AF5A5|nr:non-heme iron oxygenase ferredoxin subunit [Pseudonocardia sp. TRM90224]
MRAGAAAPTGGPTDGPAGPSPLATWHQKVFAAVEKWPWLSSLNDNVSGVTQPLYDRYRDNLAVELMHGGRWAGHSVHAALSDLPIGFWSGALVLDVVDVLGEKRSSRRAGSGDAAATLSAAGLVAAAATVATGVTDWTVSDGADRRVGLFHGLLNLTGTALQAASLAARLGGRRGTAHGLGLASMAVTAAAGFVGGHLVQGRAVMVNRVATTTGPRSWVRALPEPELAEGTSAHVVVEGRQIMLHRADEQVYALDDLCSHAGALLSRGEVTDCIVTCPLHESRFDIRDGHIVRGPAHHPQPALPTRVRNGWIEVRGSQPASRRARN